MFAAICAGALAGGVMTMFHQLAVVPLIARSEVFEAGAEPADHDAVDPHAVAHEHSSSGTERVLLTVLADLLAGIGFALLLCAGLALRGGKVSLVAGVAWGLAGFCAASLAPSLGVPPALPGAHLADLPARQIWWLGTVIATATGLALLAFGYRLPLALTGLALIVLPHLIGAPHAPDAAAILPADLERSFVLATIATNLVFWLLLGAACVFFMRRFAPTVPASS